MISWLANIIMVLIDKHRPHMVQYITLKSGKKVYEMDDESDPVYLIRYILIPKNKWFSIYLHRFLLSDQRTPHDHPWSFLTYVISGGYTEEVHNLALGMKKHRRLAGQWIYRRAEHLHRVVVNKPLLYKDRDKSSITLCFVGRRTREWGFMTEINGWYKWTRWQKFLGIDA